MMRADKEGGGEVVFIQCRHNRFKQVPVTAVECQRHQPVRQAPSFHGTLHGFIQAHHLITVGGQEIHIPRKSLGGHGVFHGRFGICTYIVVHEHSELFHADIPMAEMITPA